MKKLYIIVLFIFGLINLNAQSNSASQTIELRIDEIKLLNVYGAINNNVIFIKDSSNFNYSGSDLYLNFTSIIAENNPHYITVELKEKIEGVKIYLSGIKQIPMGGDFPEAPNRMELTGGEQVFIYGINSCYSGVGIGKGYKLLYQIEVENNAIQNNMIILKIEYGFK